LPNIPPSRRSLFSVSFNVFKTKALLSEKKKKLEDFPDPVKKLCIACMLCRGMKDLKRYSALIPNFFLISSKIYGACSIIEILISSPSSI